MLFVRLLLNKYKTVIKGTLYHVFLIKDMKMFNVQSREKGDREMFHSIIEAILYYASHTPDALCVADNNTSYTYSSFAVAIKSAAQYLSSKGIKKADCVVVECTQNTDYCVWQYAIALVGAVFVPIDKKTNSDRLEEVVKETGAVYVIASSIKNASVEVLSSAVIKELEYTSENEWMLPNGEQLSEILFSSGTTGKPKGVMLTHNNNVAIAENIKNGVEMKPGNVELIPVALSHSHGLRTMYANFLSGNAVLIANGATFLKPIFKLMEEYKATALDLVPSAWRLIYKMGAKELSTFKDMIDYVQLGSAPLSEDDKNALREVLPNSRLYNFYGSTESGRTCTYDFAEYIGKKDCIGKPACNAYIYVVDSEKNKINHSSVDMPGLLAFEGKMNMLGYLNNVHLTEEIIDKGVIYSKDVGYIDEEGWVYTVGREDDLINFGGVKIGPQEIETVALTHPSVADCACVGRIDAVSGEVPCLFIKFKEGQNPSGAEIKAHLHDFLDKDKMPKYLYSIDEIPRSFNGKLLRRSLKEIKEYDLSLIR